ncbi:MAG: ethanolamine ammonia-lyase subunit EutB [Gammaproteobacteria bacterium]
MDAQDLREILIGANEPKEGDLPLGGSWEPAVRLAARRELVSLTLRELATTPLVEDAMSELLLRSRPALPAEAAGLTIGVLKDILLGPKGAAWAAAHAETLPSEATAALVKVMNNSELSRVALGLHNPLQAAGRDSGALTIGAPGHLGSRIQPNSPGDDEEEVLFSILEGLSYGCGDVILGINPASDDLDSIIRLEVLLHGVVERLALPTRYCVLSDLIKQSEVRRHTRVDVGFQSLAGTSKALVGMVGLDLDGVSDLAQGFDGLYFETGQGSEVTNGTAEGVDMVTLEARTYGAARYIRQSVGARGGRAVWMIVNDVAGFIGPEVFRSPEQLLRACLEDTVMAKLHGITMGLDVCATFHMGIAPDVLRSLTETIAEQAAPAYLMAVAGNADPMLGYLTTAFRDHPRLRARTGCRIATAMQDRLMDLGVMGPDGTPVASTDSTAALYARYCNTGGDPRPPEILRREAVKKLSRLRQRGYDLGYGHGPGYAAPAEVQARLDGIYRHARRALFARIEETVLKDACQRYLRLASEARDRDDYIGHPARGERIAGRHIGALEALRRGERPVLQVVISDGLNANAVNAQLRLLLPALQQRLGEMGQGCTTPEIVIDNGRVRAGYHVAAVLQPEVLVHLIGERPGTGLDSLSAYLTYGRDALGQLRWNPALDHACTTAVCGIHPQGKAPQRAAVEITGLVQRMLTERRSGVALSQGSAASRKAPQR